MINNINKKDIVLQVSRILKSPTFQKSKILTDFLNYIVTETLAGNEQYLKEYVIATKVLKKNQDFNPQVDAVVRIHAHRLRNHLEEYYTKKGRLDSIRIQVPKGRYIPLFEEITSNDQSVKDLTSIGNILESKPLIAILPFYKVQENTRLDVICTVFCQDLSIELSRFNEIDTVSYYAIQHASEKMNDQSEIIQSLNADFVFTGSCFVEEANVKVNIELNSVQESKIIWANSFLIEDFQNSELLNYQIIIRNVLASTCSFFGLIYRNTLNANAPIGYDQLYAIYWHNRYHKYFSEEAFHETMKAIDIGLEKNPENALLIAFKAELYLNLLAFDVQSEVDFLKLGQQLLTKSIDIDPNNQHTFQVMAWANILSHNKAEARSSMNKCLSINPNNAMYRGSIGFGFVIIGEYKKGLDLLTEAILFNPYYHWNVNLGFCLYYMQDGDFDQALNWAEKINKKKLLWDPLIRAALLGLLGRINDARDAVQELMQLSPNFPERATIIIDTFLLEEKLQPLFFKGLQLAGIKILDQSDI